MPNGDEERADFEREQRKKDTNKQAYADKHREKSYPVDMVGEKTPYDPSKDMLEKMHADDDALSVKDAERFTDEQKAAALAQARAYLDRHSLHPSPHAARDKTEEWDMRQGSAPWDDPKTWPMPPALPMPSPEAMDKLKDTIEKLGQGKEGGGFRMNAGKNEIELLPEIWLWAIADVMTQGARKYPARNWEKGMDWSAMIGCMYRHLAKFQSGQRYDGKEFNKELGTTGCHELAMVAWNALALMFYDIYELGENDLPVYENIDHFIRVNGSGSDLAVRWAKEEVNDGS